MNLAKRLKNVSEPAGEPAETQTLDPRPDFKEDSHLWDKLLRLANDVDTNLAATLNGFRCMGTRIKKGRTGYVLRPDVDPVTAWDSREQYEEMRDKWLIPHTKVIVELLRLLLRKAS